MDRSGATTWTFLDDGDPVGAVSAVHAETAFLPVDQGVEPLEERNPQYQVRVHGCHEQVHIESDRVHGHIDVHKFCAGDCVAGCCCEGLTFVQSVAFESPVLPGPK